MFERLSKRKLFSKNNASKQTEGTQEQFYSYSFFAEDGPRFLDLIGRNVNIDFRIAVKRTNPENPDQFRYYDVISRCPLATIEQNFEGGIEIDPATISITSAGALAAQLATASPEQIKKYKKAMQKMLEEALEKERKANEIAEKEVEQGQMLLALAKQIKYQQ